MEDDESFSDDEEPDPISFEGVPFVRVNKERRDELRRPWPFSVIVKLLGRSLTFALFRQRIVKLWKLDQ